MTKSSQPQPQSQSNVDKVVSSLALFCVGICFVVWADAVTDWLAIALGVIALIYAIVVLIKFIRLPAELRTTLPLFYFVLSATAGVLLVTRANFVKEAISFIIGIYVILTCAVQLMNISELRRRTSEKIGSYLWSIIGIVVGVLCVTGQFIIPDALARLTGVALIVYSIVYLGGFIAIKVTQKKVQKDIDRALGIKEGEIVSAPKSEKSKSSKKSKN